MTYAVNDGIIFSSRLNLHVVHHCNLSCRACTQTAPVNEKYHMSPTRVTEDLSMLAKYYRVKECFLSGGEPLLHPDLPALLGVVQSLEISKRVGVSTNGVLLWRMTDDFWKKVDLVQVAQYADKALTTEQLELCQRQAKMHGVTMWVYDTPNFVESYSELEAQDQSHVQRIYDTCSLKYEFHSVEDGYFFKCPRSLFFPMMLDDKFPSPTVDGIKIVDSLAFGQDLLVYLESPNPLASCRYCLGNVGKLIPHEQVPRRSWRKLQHRPIEEMVDWNLLALLERAVKRADSSSKQQVLARVVRLASRVSNVKRLSR